VAALAQEHPYPEARIGCGRSRLRLALRHFEAADGAQKVLPIVETSCL